MDFSVITQLIGSLGFPIAACCAMGYYCIKTQNEITKINELHRDEIKEINAKHSDDIQKMTEAVNNNTIALKSLCAKLGVDSGD